MEERGLRILVIDDEEMIRVTLSAFLKRWGYDTVQAENGQLGLDIFEQEQIDLVLTDLDMPVMGGLKVLAHLHQNSPDTPVIIISGAGQLNDAVQTVKLGAWDYLTKPISNMVILENSINRCLEKVRLVKENKKYQVHLEIEVRKKTEELRKNNEALRLEIMERMQKQQELLSMYKHLEEIVDASGELFSHLDLKSLMAGVLKRLSRHIRKGLSVSDQPADLSSLATLKQKDETIVISGTGKYEPFDGKNIDHVLSQDMVHRLRSVYAGEKSVVEGREFFAYMKSAHDIECILYFDNVASLGDADQRLVQLYITNVASALDSFVVNEELINTQKELVITLGEVIETRSKESANHVRRVAEYSYLLATFFGLSVSESQMLRFAAPMHDAGKIGIPDSILNKPGKLTAEEFSVMEEHTVMGYDILKGSERPILKAAATVA